MAKATTKIGRDGKSGKFVGTARVLSTTEDGVNILKPRGRATYFTSKELRDTLLSVRCAKTA